MERQCCTLHQKCFLTPLWPMQGTWEEQGVCNYFVYRCSAVWQFSSLGRKCIVQRLQEPHAMQRTGRLAVQSKMNLCLLVFVLSVDTSAQHINYVMLPTCLYPVCRPVPAEKDAKIYGVGPKRQR